LRPCWRSPAKFGGFSVHGPTGSSRIAHEAER
jgi:hypothetical protein